MDKDLKNEISPQDLSAIPTTPGCYIFKHRFEERDQILYIGKAKNLRARVRQYFRSDSDKRFYVSYIKERTTNIEYIGTKDERDAFILENELIKKHRPLYNISLKDDRRYLSLRLDIQHEWPRVEVVRKIKKDRAIYLGPFSSSTRLKETLNIMQKVFPLRTCPDRKLYNRSRPCIEYDIKRCVAPCVQYCSREEYAKLVDSVVMFLQGKSNELVQGLEAKMLTESQKENFEGAAKLRDQIFAVKQITQSGPGVINQKNIQAGIDADAYGMARDENYIVIYAMYIRGGVVWDQRSFEFPSSALDDEEIFSQLLSRYYSSEVYIPKEIYLPFDLDIPGMWGQTKMLQPRTTEKRNFLETAYENANARLQLQSEKRKRVSKVLQVLQSKLNLTRLPHRMDCVDVSHHQGSEVVASVVRFQAGLPFKDGYRKIKLSKEIVDDYESMKEALERRYKLKQDLPDLIVIDGGRGQLSSAVEVLKAKGWLSEVDVIGLAKARPSDQAMDPLNPMNRERVFKIGQKNPILLKESSPEELLLTYLRDEAHRFAIQYHRVRKNRSMSLSVLDDIEGISARRKLQLLKHFGSVAEIKEASDLDLLKFLKPQALESLRAALSKIDFSDDSSDNEEE